MEALKEHQKQTGSIGDAQDRDRTIFDIYTKGKPKLFGGSFFGSRQNAKDIMNKSNFKRRDVSAEPFWKNN